MFFCFNILKYELESHIQGVHIITALIIYLEIKEANTTI